VLPESENTEALREALLNLERLRVQEKTTRLQTEALVSGLHVLNECDSVNGMYREILDCLYSLIEFDSAAILTEEGDGCLSTVVSSDNRLQFKRVPVQGVFHRCLAGRATVLTDLSRVANWPVQAYGSNIEIGPAGGSSLIECTNDPNMRIRKYFWF